MLTWESLEFYKQFITFGNASLAGVAIAGLLKDNKSRNYLACLMFFIYFYSFAWPYIKEIDPQKLFRYVITSTSQLLFAVTVFYLSVKNMVSRVVAASASAISLIIIFAQIYRLVDRHIVDLPFAHYFVVNIVQYLNCLLVLVGYIGLIKWSFKVKQGDSK